MKSIMQEASSISKAIDLAWSRAGKPTQFSVKILEEPERNMFGLTVKSAKVALFFEDLKKAEVPARQQERQRFVRQDQPQRQPQESWQKRPQEQPKRAPTVPQKRVRPEWTESLAQEAKEWVDHTLNLIGSNVSYTYSHSRSALKFVFAESITGTEGKDRMLFSSFASLILATLRHRYKKQFRNLKVILLTE